MAMNEDGYGSMDGSSLDEIRAVVERSFERPSLPILDGTDTWKVQFLKEYGPKSRRIPHDDGDPTDTRSGKTLIAAASAVLVSAIFVWGIILGGIHHAQNSPESEEPLSLAYNCSSADTDIDVPVSNRFYIIDDDPAVRDVGAPPNINAFSGDGIELESEVKVEFKFNPDGVCDFVEGYDLRDGDFTSRGVPTAWTQFLAEKFNPAIQEAVQEELSQRTAEEILLGEARDEFEQGVQDRFNQNLRLDGQDDLFCGVGGTAAAGNCSDLRLQVRNIGSVDEDYERQLERQLTSPRTG